MNFEKYIERIGYNGPKEASLEVLKQLQYRHLISIPFENLDIHYGHTITLDTQKFYTKIIDFGRGGFCYELNGLYNELLKHFGFETRIIQSRVFNKEGKFYHDAFGHLAIIATIDGQDYLTDVGFGEFITHPVPIIMDSAIEDPSGTYKIDRFDEELLLISKKLMKTGCQTMLSPPKKWIWIALNINVIINKHHQNRILPKRKFARK